MKNITDNKYKEFNILQNLNVGSSVTNYNILDISFLSKDWFEAVFHSHSCASLLIFSYFQYFKNHNLFDMPQPRTFCMSFTFNLLFFINKSSLFMLECVCPISSALLVIMILNKHCSSIQYLFICNSVSPLYSQHPENTTSHDCQVYKSSIIIIIIISLTNI